MTLGVSHDCLHLIGSNKNLSLVTHNPIAARNLYVLGTRVNKPATLVSKCYTHSHTTKC